MIHSLPSLVPLRASLQRLRGYLEVAAQDDLGANVFEEVMRHAEPVLIDLHRFGGPSDATRAHVSALGAQLEASERGGVFRSHGELDRETKVLRPLLAAYLESLRGGGAA
jgi:hypothetical protein